MQVNISDIPYAKMCFIVLTLFFGYKLVDTIIIANLQQRAKINQLSNGYSQCQDTLRKAQDALRAALAK